MYWFIAKISYFWDSVAFAWEDDPPRWFRLSHRCIAHAMWVLGAMILLAWLGIPGVPEVLFVVLLGLIATPLSIAFWLPFSMPIRIIGYFFPRLNAKLIAIDAWLEFEKPMRENEDGLIDEWTYVPNSRLTKAQSRRAMERHARKSDRHE